jgi:hypothetical protein
VSDEKEPRRGRGAPRGNRNAVKSGIYVAGPNSDFEREVVALLAARFEANPHQGRAVSRAALDRFVADFLRLSRAVDAGDTTAIVKLDRTVRRHLKKLGAPGPPPRSPKPRPRGPEEWAAELLRFVEERK